MAKKKSKGHTSFKLSKHPYSSQQVILFALGAGAVGLALGWLLKDEYIEVLGLATF